MNNLFRAAFIIAGKDLYSEWKTKQVVTTMLIFSGLVIVTFSFAFDPSNNAVRAIIPGLIWVITIFSAILGLNRSFLSETKNDNLYGMIVSPTDPSSIYLGKVIGNFIFVLIVQLISIPVLFLLFDFRFFGHLPLFIIVVVLGTFGFISVGTFLAGLAANSKSSEMLLPILLFPIVSPIIIAAVQATKILLIDLEQISSAISWMQLMGAYNLIFFVLCFILFEYVLEV
ncbi:heme exporter protein CcmB [Anaerobacillus isosaccharinicus]|uniref:Heme exporter protein B n=1 Tax=Anaerobacillus isosaccharinicus TaxID=1532552 RepID=A0A1S2MFB8_9BACI|nr:heme exporter protein CcmB [Anaerobacillus isosaccharinicus]MBA5584165.1 heme exporter protein CcmB [Anaerobacillus isosaccharinicus]QOY37428.1 heme exporter protein CcmB [Anaerobacillus isosaccharinicus]